VQKTLPPHRVAAVIRLSYQHKVLLMEGERDNEKYFHAHGLKIKRAAPAGFGLAPVASATQNSLFRKYRGRPGWTGIRPVAPGSTAGAMAQCFRTYSRAPLKGGSTDALKEVILVQRGSTIGVEIPRAGRCFHVPELPCRCLWQLHGM
jgi:hypothetical protein